MILVLRFILTKICTCMKALRCKITKYPYQISLGFPTGSNSSISGAKIRERREIKQLSIYCTIYSKVRVEQIMSLHVNAVRVNVWTVIKMQIQHLPTYSGVPTIRQICSPSFICLAKPKSMILISGYACSVIRSILLGCQKIKKKIVLLKFTLHVLAKKQKF